MPKAEYMEKFKALYIAASNLMATLGADGQVTNTHPDVTKAMDALYQLDEGVYDIEKAFKMCEKPEYAEFGEEWQKAMMRLSKKELIAFARNVCVKNKALRKKVI